MKKLLLVIGLLFELSQISAQIKVACIGNSITAGEYPKILQTLLGDTYKVEGWGQSGSKMCFSSGSPWVKLKWPGPEGIKWQQPNIITIKLGTNDAQTGTWPNCKTQFKQDYIKFIDSLYKWVKVKPQIYLCLPSPSTDDNGFSIKGSTIKNEIIPLIREVGAQLNLPVIDLNTPLIAKQKEYFPDGVHPNSEGATEIAKLIFKSITTITSVENQNMEEVFSLSPNPATQTLEISTNANFLPTQMMVYDAIGNIAMKNNLKESIQLVDVSSLKPGIYFFKINNKIKKISIQK